MVDLEDFMTPEERAQQIERTMAERGIPTQINKIMKEIKTAWDENYKDLVKVWDQTRPSDRNLMHQKIR